MAMLKVLFSLCLSFPSDHEAKKHVSPQEVSHLDINQIPRLEVPQRRKVEGATLRRGMVPRTFEKFSASLGCF